MPARDRPLDVLWAAEVLLERAAQLRERPELVRPQHAAGHEALALDRTRAVDDVVVGCHLTGYDLLAEPANRLDDHLVPASLHRVDSEQTPAFSGVDHLWTTTAIPRSSSEPL